MNREEVEKLTLIPKDEAKDLATGKPSRYTVSGLPSHLHVEIKGGQGGYQYQLTRDGDHNKYIQATPSTAQIAFEELKTLLNWDPRLGVTRK